MFALTALNFFHNRDFICIVVILEVQFICRAPIFISRSRYSVEGFEVEV